MISSRSSVPFHHAVHHARQLTRSEATRRDSVRTVTKPAAAFRQRLERRNASVPYNAPETWHEPMADETPSGHSFRGPDCRIVVQPAGADYVHPVSACEVRERLALLPQQYTQNLQVVQFSQMSRKRKTFPCYGMQWGTSVYLYPIESSLVEMYSRPPRPAQQIEARMYGAKWSQTIEGHWTLIWTIDSLKDFYLNNVLIHEIGHLNDPRNTSYRERERFANWFAIEFGYRASRGRRRSG